MELTKKQKKILNIAQKIENGEITHSYINDYFDGFNNFIQIIYDENLINYINPFSSEWENYQNHIFWVICQNNPDYVYEIIEKFLMNDIDKEGNNYYLVIDPDELADLFSTSRSDISEETIASIISGEYDHDVFFGDIVDDVYRDIYEYLDEKSKNLVKEKIKKELFKIGELDVTHITPTLFDEILTKQQGSNGKIETLDREVIDSLINDDESLEYLIKDVFDEIRFDLTSIYHGCYSSELSDSWYEDIMDSLTGFIIDNDERKSFSYKKMVINKDGKSESRTFYRDKYLVNSCAKRIVLDWLDENKNHTGGYTIEYYGGILQVLKNLIYDGVYDHLRVPRLDDYPDYRKTIKCVNENIGSYF
jgi:hypothetical protein